MRRAPGSVRDSIVSYLAAAESASLGEIQQAVSVRLGDVPASSIRSYLNINTPHLFERPSPGRYRLRQANTNNGDRVEFFENHSIGLSKLVHADCFDWLRSCEPNSIEAVVTDPPYGLIEYSEEHQSKLRSNSGGGVWRVPPSFDGHTRSPLPRFTVLSDTERTALGDFFYELGTLLLRVTVPGANVVIASNPLLSHIVAGAMSDAGLELRGSISRLVMTMRGGDRPKNAHQEFLGVSVMPRSMFEPWVVLRHPLDGRVQDNLRKWKTGGFRRISDAQPFGDVIKSSPTPLREKRLAPHPSLKPQAFLRHIVYAVLPLGQGTIIDPFAGSGSTLAAANAVGYQSIGIERDAQYISVAKESIPKLTQISVGSVDPI